MKNRLAVIVGLFAVLSIVGLAHQAISKDPIRVADRVQHRMQLALVGEDETVTKRIPDLFANQPIGAPVGATRTSLRTTQELSKVEGHSAAMTLRQLLENSQTTAVIESSERSITVVADAHTQTLVIDLIAAMDAR